MVPFSIGKQDIMFWISPFFCASNFGAVPTFQLASPNESLCLINFGDADKDTYQDNSLFG
jgi:hypothetical protein